MRAFRSVAVIGAVVVLGLGWPSFADYQDPEILKLKWSDTTAGDRFGDAVAADGSAIAVGATGVDVDGQARQGAAYVVTRVGGVWGVEGFKFTAADGAAEDQFGFAVALSGSTLVVGAPDDDDNGEDSGTVYVYLRQGDSWVEQAKLWPSDAKAAERFGYSVAIDGDTIAVGMWQDEDNLVDVPGTLIDDGFGQASVYVFERQGSSWAQQDRITLDEASADGTFDGFGNVVALSGDYLAVGAERTDVASTSDAGVVRIFRRDGGQWPQIAVINASNPIEEGFFGSDVAIDADHLAVGAPGDFNPLFDPNPANDFGAAYVFRRSGELWLEQSELLPPQAELDDSFGASVSIQGDRVLVGAPLADRGFTDQGSAFVYQGAGTNWPIVGELIADDALIEDLFGGPIALGDNYAFIGAPRQCDASGCSAGAGYLFVSGAAEAALFADGFEDPPPPPNDNVPPGLSSIADQVTSTLIELRIDFSVTDENSATVAVTADSSVAGVVATNGLTISGTGQARTLTIAPGVVGTTTITLTASDQHGATNQATFDLEVTAPFRTELEILPEDTSVAANFGFAVDISDDGSFFAVGAPATVLDSNPGAVYMFQRSSGHLWVEEVKLLAGEITAGSEFGRSVDMAGAAVIGGAPHDDNGLRDSGSAIIFERVGGQWVELPELTASDAMIDDEFGHAVAIDGDYAVATAPYNDEAGDNAGAAYVFQRLGGVWSEQTKLMASDATAGDLFGYSVALDGDTVVIGARSKNGTEIEQGAAYVFRRNGNTWSEEDKLLASDPSEDDDFGTEVTIEGDAIAVGAPGFYITFSDKGNPVGKAYVFERSGSNWTEQQILQPFDADDGAEFGGTLDLRGDYLLIGAPDIGTSFVFKRDAQWSEDHEIFAGVESVALADDYAVIGSPQASVGHNCSLIICQQAGRATLHK